MPHRPRLWTAPNHAAHPDDFLREVMARIPPSCAGQPALIRDVAMELMAERLAPLWNADDDELLVMCESLKVTPDPSRPLGVRIAFRFPRRLEDEWRSKGLLTRRENAQVGEPDHGALGAYNPTRRSPRSQLPGGTR